MGAQMGIEPAVATRHGIANLVSALARLNRQSCENSRYRRRRGRLLSNHSKSNKCIRHMHRLPVMSPPCYR
ncbi:unnamed protein product [Merluccius merluccius]